jgi:hypothetical protein
MEGALTFARTRKQITALRVVTTVTGLESVTCRSRQFRDAGIRIISFIFFYIVIILLGKVFIIIAVCFARPTGRATSSAWLLLSCFLLVIEH